MSSTVGLRTVTGPGDAAGSVGGTGRREPRNQKPETRKNRSFHLQKLTAGTGVNPRNPVPAAFQIDRYKQKVKPKTPNAHHDLCRIQIQPYACQVALRFVENSTQWALSAGEYERGESTGAGYLRSTIANTSSCERSARW